MNFGKGNSDAIVSLLGEGVEIVGEISFTQGVRVDGVIKGRIRSDASLSIGPKGNVEAEINIRRISISGEFRGTIHASERVQIHKEGRVFGDLYTPCLIIEAGAIFEGKCNMGEGKEAKVDDAAMLKAVESAEVTKAAHQAAGSEKPWIKRNDLPN
jgi:cytoskeletal protein CcmA (bactofilin family)